ncbi:hypothetical protein [Algoriphagus namhaensis]
MKKQLYLCLITLLSPVLIFAQQNQGWSANKLEVRYANELGNQTSLKIDPSFNYADLKIENTVYHFYFHRNGRDLGQIRIINAETKEEIARGRGSWFLDNAHLEFFDGEKVLLDKSTNPNGYTIIGPYGPLFVVENQKIETPKTYTQKDFLTQAFFVFERIRNTQAPPNHDFFVYYSILWGLSSN